MPQKGEWLYWCVLIIGLLFPVGIFWVIVTDMGEIDKAKLLGDGDDDGDDDDDYIGGGDEEGDADVGEEGEPRAAAAGSETRAMKVVKAYKAKLNRSLRREAAAVIVVGGSLVLVGGFVGDGNDDDRNAGDSWSTTTGTVDDEAAFNTTGTTPSGSDDDGGRGDGNIIGLGGIILVGGFVHLFWRKAMDIKLDAGLSQYNYRLDPAYREMRVFVCSRCEFPLETAPIFWSFRQ